MTQSRFASVNHVHFPDAFVGTDGSALSFPVPDVEGGFAPLDGDLKIPAEYLPTVAGETVAITFILDGGGSAISTGIKGDLLIPFACTINSWTILPDISGSIVIDIWNDTYANFPPTDADSITASAPPTLNNTTKATSSSLTGWDPAIAADDILRFNVDSITSCTRVTLSLNVTKV